MKNGSTSGAWCGHGDWSARCRESYQPLAATTLYAALEATCARIEALYQWSMAAKWPRAVASETQCLVACRSSHESSKDTSNRTSTSTRQPQSWRRRSRSNLGCGRTEAPHTHRDQAPTDQALSVYSVGEFLPNSIYHNSVRLFKTTSTTPNRREAFVQ